MKKYVNTGNKDTRSGFGAGLHEAGKADPRIVALTADLGSSVKMDAFASEFPDRFIQCGIAEGSRIRPGECQNCGITFRPHPR